MSSLNKLNQKQLKTVKVILEKRVDYILGKNLEMNPFFKNELQNIRIMLFEINNHFGNEMSANALNILLDTISDQIKLNKKLNELELEELKDIYTTVKLVA